MISIATGQDNLPLLYDQMLHSTVFLSIDFVKLLKEYQRNKGFLLSDVENFT